MNELQQWIKRNLWCREIPFKIAFQVNGDLNDMLQSAIMGETLPRIWHFKEIFQKAQIALWISSQDEKISRDLWSTIPFIDQIIWRKDDPIFRSQLNEFLDKNEISKQKYNWAYNTIRFPIQNWVMWNVFLAQCGLKLDWFVIKKPLLPKLIDEDLIYAKNIIKEPTIGISLFSEYPNPNEKVWDEIIESILNRGFKIALFGLESDRDSEYYQSVLTRYDNIINMVGITDIRKLLAVMKSCLAHITVNSELCSIPWIYQIPSVFLHVQTAKMTDLHINGHFWKITNQKWKNNGARIVIQEADRDRLDLSERIWKVLEKETTFLDNIQETKRG